MDFNRKKQTNVQKDEYDDITYDVFWVYGIGRKKKKNLASLEIVYNPFVGCKQVTIFDFNLRTLFSSL